MKDTQRELGAVMLMTPAMLNIESNEIPATGAACNVCLAFIAQTLDFWRNGGINNLIAKLQANQLLKIVP